MHFTSILASIAIASSVVSALPVSKTLPEQLVKRDVTQGQLGLGALGVTAAVTAVIAADHLTENKKMLDKALAELEDLHQQISKYTKAGNVAEVEKLEARVRALTGETQTLETETKQIEEALASQDGRVTKNGVEFAKNDVKNPIVKDTPQSTPIAAVEGQQGQQWIEMQELKNVPTPQPVPVQQPLLTETQPLDLGLNTADIPENLLTENLVNLEEPLNKEAMTAAEKIGQEVGLLTEKVAPNVGTEFWQLAGSIIPQK